MTQLKLHTVKLAELPPAGEILSPEELEVYRSLKFPKRRTDWLGGRLAAKRAAVAAPRAVRAGMLPLENGPREISLKDVAVFNLETGQPCCKIGETLVPVSITHSGDYAIAAILPPNFFAVGVDTEKIEQRPDCWVEECFHPSEITDSSPEKLTALWTQKEAVLKLAGLGLRADLWEARIKNGKPFFYGALSYLAAIKKPELLTIAYPAGYMTTVALSPEPVPQQPVLSPQKAVPLSFYSSPPVGGEGRVRGDKKSFIRQM